MAPKDPRSSDCRLPEHPYFASQGHWQACGSVGNAPRADFPNSCPVGLKPLVPLWIFARHTRCDFMIKICSSLRPLHPLLYDKRNDFGNTPFNVGTGVFRRLSPERTADACGGWTRSRDLSRPFATYLLLTL